MKKLQASEILDRLNAGVVKEFHGQGNNLVVQDGIDIALWIFDKKHQKLQFSGAINPLYISRKGEIIQVKANNFPIDLTINRN